MDHGWIIIGTDRFPLLKIIKEKGNTGYVIPREAVCEKGMSVRCELDRSRRLSIMRLHSAQHLLAGALRMIRPSILTGGMKIHDNANQCGVFYPADSGLRENELASALVKVQELIHEDRSIRAESVVSEAEAILKYNELYRPTIASGSLKGTIRLVLIDGVDANACGGTHVKSLKEVGSITIDSFHPLEEGSEILFSVGAIR